MAAFLPFEPLVESAVAGQSVYIAAGVVSANTTFDATGSYAPSVLVTNLGAVDLFVRLSTETTAVAVATSTDIPLNALDSVILANPNAVGSSTYAAISPGGAAQVMFTPGQGGLF